MSRLLYNWEEEYTGSTAEKIDAEFAGTFACKKPDQELEQLRKKTEAEREEKLNAIGLKSYGDRTISL